VIERHLAGVLVTLDDGVKQPKGDDVVALRAEIRRVEFGILESDFAVLEVPAGVDQRCQ